MNKNEIYKLPPPPRNACGSEGLAFTLAEVLVTLTILGVIAAITVPSIVRNFQDRAQITGMKKAYSMLDNAMHMMYVIDGDPYKWELPVPRSGRFFDNAEDGEYYMRKLAQYLPVERYCGTTEGCWRYGQAKSWGRPAHYSLTKQAAYEEAGYGRMILKNDMRIKMVSMEWAENDPIGIGRIAVDVNGRKGPNRYGYDVFFFNFDNQGLVLQARSGCNNNHGYQFCSGNCNLKRNGGCTGYSCGYSCSTWIMRHNNMDYKYRDVTNDW